MARDSKLELRNKVIYQIFTRNYKGGTFQAVEEDLERIKALGVDYIYFLPVQPSGEVHRKGSMGSPYAIKDYSDLMSTLAAIKKNEIFAKGSFEAKAIGRQKDIILAVREMKNPADGTSSRSIGIFSLSGATQSIHVDLPDGFYKNAINGKEIDVFEKIMAYDGEPVIIVQA